MKQSFFSGGKRIPEHVENAPSAIDLVRLQRMFRPAERPQGMVGRVAEVLHGIEQRAVQVEYDQFRHVANIRPACGKSKKVKNF